MSDAIVYMAVIGSIVIFLCGLFVISRLYL